MVFYYYFCNQIKTARQKKPSRRLLRKGRHLLKLKGMQLRRSARKQHQRLKQKRLQKMERQLEMINRRPLQRPHQPVIQSRPLKKKSQPVIQSRPLKKRSQPVIQSRSVKRRSLPVKQSRPIKRRSQLTRLLVMRNLQKMEVRRENQGRRQQGQKMNQLGIRLHRDRKRNVRDTALFTINISLC